MNFGLILAGGVGQRMRNSGKPKQFLEIYGKPILIYTLEKFEACKDIDMIVLVSNPAWIEYTQELIKRYGLKKVTAVTGGGKDRQGSVENGLRAIESAGGKNDDIVVIHDGVRPLIETSIISENIRVAQRYGSAMTVRQVVESVVVTSSDTAGFDSFKKRNDTYTLTAPQTFTIRNMHESYQKIRERAQDSEPIPLLDTALVWTFLGNNVHLVKENNHNIKITTPEDYYMLRAILEMKENQSVFGI